MNRHLCRPLARTHLLPGLIAVLGIFALSPSSGQRLPGLVQAPESAATPPAKPQPQTPSSPPPAPTQKATDTQYGHGYTNIPKAAPRKAPSPPAPPRETTEQEERRSTEEWYAQRNQAAASGEIVYLAQLLDATHGHSGDPAMAKPGLGKARDAGSKLAAFLYAAFDYNTVAKESPTRTQAIEAIKALKGYPAADYWLAERGIAPATTNADTKRKNAEAVLVNMPSGVSAAADYVRAMARCRALDWRACMSQLQAPSLQDNPQAQATRGMLHLTENAGFYNPAQARALLAAAIPALRRMEVKQRSSYELAIAWLAQQGLGGPTDPAAAETFFQHSRSTPSATLDTNIRLKGRSCGQLEYTGRTWESIPIFDAEGGLREVAHVIEPVAATRWDQAVTSCRAKAEAGDADAMAFLGDALLHNCPGGVSDKQCDRKEGATWLAKAAQTGSVYGAYATILRAKDDLPAARQALAQAKFDADTQLAARYTIAKADAKTPAQEYESIARALKNRSSFWQPGDAWAQAMLVQMIQGKKLPASYQGDALRAYATYMGLLDVNGGFKRIVLTTDLNKIHWLMDNPIDKITSLDDELRYAQLMAGCAWERDKNYSCNDYAQGFQWRRPHSMAVKPGEPPKRVADRWLGEWWLTSSGTLQAPLTALEWMPCFLGETWNGTGQNCMGNSKAETKKSTANTVRAFNAAGGFGGHSDWRLPTVEELHTLAHCRGSTRSTLRTQGGVVVPKACIDVQGSGEDVRRDLFPSMPYSLIAARPERGDSQMDVNMNEDFKAVVLRAWEGSPAEVLLVRTMK